ncbi:MAG: hypothetical protein K6E40_16695, partial [Desulfovibrio sp.]|nr:hypothetical protein [Desulfovibrio sp.]
MQIQTRNKGSMADVQRKAQALAALAENFGKPLSPALAEMWMRLLQEYTPDQVERGAMHVLRSYTYKTLPPFAVLREAIHDACDIPIHDGTQTQTHEAEAEAAWAQVHAQISEVGYYGTPALTPAEAYAVRICGGWQRL